MEFTAMDHTYDLSGSGAMRSVVERLDRVDAKEAGQGAMINPEDPVGSAKKADLEIRQELLAALGIPLGAATIARRSTTDGDTLVVRMTAPGLLPDERRIALFKGFPVTYEIVRPVEIRRR